MRSLRVPSKKISKIGRDRLQYKAERRKPGEKPCDVTQHMVNELEFFTQETWDQLVNN